MEVFNSKSIQGLKILLVEDELDLAEVFVLQMEKEGAEVVHAKTCSEGCHFFGREEFDLAITDIRLPDDDGTQFVQYARAKDPSFPIICMSGHTGESPQVAKILGADEFLPKPFTFSELKAVVCRVAGL